MVACRISHNVASDLILKKATAIEASVLSDHKHDTGKDYKGKIRSLYLNLKDKSNPGLREDIMNGTLAITRFTKMTSQVTKTLSFSWVSINYSFCVVGNGFGRAQGSRRCY